MKPKLIVELGVQSGNSYNAFCQAVDYLSLKTRCYGVDNWKGDFYTGLYSDEIYKELMDYQSQTYPELSTLLKMDFDKARNKFDDHSIDLLHIDGLHTYEAVKHDFNNWLPKLSDHSVVLLHDTQVRQADFGVWKFWQEVSLKYLVFDFYHCFGLGIVKTGRKANNSLFNMNPKEQQLFRTFFRKLGTGLLLKFALSQTLLLSNTCKYEIPELYKTLNHQYEEERIIIRAMEYVAKNANKN
ncbi:MAG: class I SAM-dependent methyltransferase [Bacteroidales bacterium]|nr:class I SAM-dependent methyltransferase [Bacteroidales bacterium]